MFEACHCVLYHHIYQLWIYLLFTLQIDDSVDMEINNNKTHKMDPDPFKVRLEFTKSDYVRMGLMGVTILPIRILGKITAFTLYCIASFQE